MDNNALNMATQALSLGGDTKPKPKPVATNTTNTPTPNYTQDQLNKFSNWASPAGDFVSPKTAALDLQKRGLVGSDQIMDNANIDINNPNSTANSQATAYGVKDWKPQAIREILMSSMEKGVRDKPTFMANWKNFVQTPVYQDAVKNPVFSNIHTNFPDTVYKILQDQWAKHDAMDKQNLVTK
jgi:hypothetical protein